MLILADCQWNVCEDIISPKNITMRIFVEHCGILVSVCQSEPIFLVPKLCDDVSIFRDGQIQEPDSSHPVSN